MVDFFEKLKKGMGIKKNEEKVEENGERRKKKIIKTEPKQEKWFEPAGQLTIDVYQTEKDLVIQSAIAGIKPEDLDISIEKDILIIKGIREGQFEGEEKRDYFFQECYWGPFLREIILPVEVDSNQIEAKMKQGILTIKIPKLEKEKKRKIEVK